MEENNDFLKLSVEDRCQHKVWKARLSGYEDAAKLFIQQDDEKSPEFLKYLGLLKKFVIDSNAVAQEKGLSAVLAFVENAACAPKTVNDIMGGLVSKCFSSPRAKTRDLALEIALMYIEIEKQDVVLEELIKGLENKSPKVVAACIIALRESLHLFGSQVIAIKPLVKVMTKLLEDRDKSVRDESKMLCVEIYRWVGEAIKPQLQSLKPLTLTELEGEFQKTAGERVAATRYLKSQQQKIAKAKEESSGDAVDVDDAVESGPPQVDAYDLMTAVDVLSKLPKNFYEQCEAKKWQERKEVLETLQQLTTNSKLESGDYGDLVRVLKKFIAKDSNVLVVALAAKCLTNLVLGLRKKFQPYASACIPAIFEKFKEKKQNVVVALKEVIDALYSISSLDIMLEDIQAALNNKNPQVKSETCAFLTRCFCSCSPAQLNKKLLKAFTVALLKTLNDTDATVRENSAEALGTALKVVGERVMQQFLQEVDAIKMAKIKDFCDKAVVAAKPQVSQAVEKKPASAPARSVVKSEEHIPKSVMGGARKVASASALKPKTTSTQSKAVKSGAAAKKGGSEPVETQFKEQDLTDEDVTTQATEIFSDDIIAGLRSSNWKDRLAAVEKFMEIVQQMEKGSIPAQMLIKLLARKPGFKENNFQILKLRFEVLAYIADNGKISHISVESCLSDVVDKIGDAKNGGSAASALSSLAEATSLEYVSVAVLNSAFGQRNPRNQSEAILWVSNAIKQFGLKINVKEIIEFLKKGFSSTNPAVRNAALALVGTMYMYVGKNLRSFFEDEKPALLQQIDSEFEKMKDLKPPVAERGKGSKQGGSAGDSAEGSKGESAQQVNLADLIPRVDISGQITQQLLLDLADKDWHLRNDALQKLSGIISDAKFVTPSLGDLPNALKPRLADTNKRLAVQALSICQMLGTSLGSHCSKHIRNFAPGILICLGDNKANVRAAALQCFNTWMDNCPLTNLFEGEMIFDVLKSDNPFLRIELFSWLAEKLPIVTSLPAAELNLCVPILLGCLEDRNADVRKKASECLLPFMIHIGYQSMASATSKLKPASKNTVIAQLEKVRQNLPEKPSSKSKQAKASIPAPSDRSSPPQAPGTEGKLNRSTSKSKLALKAPSVSSKGKKEEEIDMSPSLVVNNMKDQRLLDEKGLKILKWNFTTPREEFYSQLKDQMVAANWSKTLISHCFHNDFKFHIKAIDLFIESLDGGVEASAANLDLILKWLALRFFDTNPSVLIRSLEYLQALLQSLAAMNYRLLEPEAASFVPYLLLKIGDSKDPVRKGVREILKIIGKIYPSSKMFSYIMQGLGSKNARQRAECLEELGSMIEIFGLSVCQPSPAIALKDIAKQISDRDNSVRNASLNCFVQAYFIEGEKVYKYVGQLSDKDMSLLEERIKRSTKTRSIKPPESKLPSSIVSSSPINLNAAAVAVEEPHKLPHRNPPTGPLRLDTDDIEQMFRHTKSDFEVQGLVQVNADDILNLPDIRLPPTRLRPPASSLKLLNNSLEANTAVNLVMAQLTAQEIPVVVEAFAQVEEVLKQSEQAVAVLGPRVDQLLVMGAMQYRYAHTKHMADENICKADVIRLYRCVTAALITLFDNPVLAKKASRDVLRDLIPHLITVMLDNRLDDLQEGAQVVKVTNVLILRILQKANPTHVLSALIKLLHDCVGSVNVSDRFTDLVMKCLWKNIRLIRQVISELNIDRILLDIHVFLKAFPSSSWKERKDDTPIRTVKTIMYHLIEIKDEEIMKHLTLISDRQESDMVNYLHKLLAKRKGDKRKSLNKNVTPEDNRHKRSRSSPLKLSKSTHEALTEIFKKIGSKDQTKEGLSELYDFTQNHPEADIEPYLKNSSEFFQDYIRRGIKDLERKKSSDIYGQDSPIVKSDETAGWNSNLSANDSVFKHRPGSQIWQEKFPPLPPPTIDTTPMDLVEWLKSTVARLGFDPSKYDDPAFLEKMMGNGNEGTVTTEDISQMFADIDRYKKIVEDLRNAA